MEDVGGVDGIDGKEVMEGMKGICVRVIHKLLSTLFPCT